MGSNLRRQVIQQSHVAPSLAVEVNIFAAHRHQRVRVAVHDHHLAEASTLEALLRLVATNQTVVPVDEHRAARTIVLERAFNQLRTLLGTIVETCGRPESGRQYPPPPCESVSVLPYFMNVLIYVYIIQMLKLDKC